MKVQALISSVVPFIEWLFITPPLPLTGQQYGNIELIYPRVVTARVYYVPRRAFNLPLILINSVETAALINMVSNP